MPTSKPPRYIWPVRVYYEDTDAGGVVFYANYLKYFERARTEYFRQLGLNMSDVVRTEACMFVVKATNVEYHASARLDDELTVSVGIEKIGRASLVFVQEVCCAQRLLTSATVTVCCVDVEAWRSMPIPTVILDVIKQDVFDS